MSTDFGEFFLELWDVWPVTADYMLVVIRITMRIQEFLQEL